MKGVIINLFPFGFQINSIVNRFIILTFIILTLIFIGMLFAVYL